MGDTTMTTIGGKPVLRFERVLAHPPAKVWRAVSDPDELKHWFPAVIEAEAAAGASMRFVMDDGEDVTSGEVLEYDPPKVYAFRWADEVLRFEILSHERGSVLVFTHTLTEGQEFIAARNTAGWEVCLVALEARLDGVEAELPDHRPLMESYVEHFGIGRGEVVETADGFEVRFRRDVVWRPVETVWEMLADGGTVTEGQAPPPGFTAGPIQAGQVTEVESPRLLVFEWTLNGLTAGQVRWKLVHEPRLATYVELTQTVARRFDAELPVLLAAWQVRLEVLFGSLLGLEREWSDERFNQLRAELH
ncbi:SRPBCC family protein [Amycolatopsis suaedae]|uniref:Activator of Hsp90 ATPase homologue 1/2-like C-terminal domain-containing protein n=1 Tax=Amycolatopsis suaedae TaxID=2510978 RepID=A0A4Q7J4K1_9PSEU|nr:SRPBCC family protein [Amycolatopsis suaedae]RZQ61738.1 hypothetical protein EWH70_22545 [Amycolatopsis suaedae]